MDWVKLSARFYTDPSVASLPDADAELGFVRSLAYCGAEETGGFIPRNIVPSLFRRRRYEAAVEALVACSLWVPVCGDRDQLEGWRIARWQDWQEELDVLARRRSADRDRKRRERNGKEKQQVRPMSRDVSAGQSRDRPQDVTPPERESERSSRGYLGEGCHVGQRAREKPPTPENDPGERPAERCPRHAKDPDPPNCGQCADARRAAQRWDQQAETRQQQLADWLKAARNDPRNRCEHGNEAGLVTHPDTGESAGCAVCRRQQREAS